MWAYDPSMCVMSVFDVVTVRFLFYFGSSAHFALRPTGTTNMQDTAKMFVDAVIRKNSSLLSWQPPRTVLTPLEMEGAGGRGGGVLSI